MKVISLATPRCDCMTKLADFEVECRKDLGFDRIEVGSIVECDCGQAYVKQDSQFDGVYWAKVNVVKSMVKR